MNADDVEQLVRRGHFVYESGDHGDLWLALELLFTDPRRVQLAAAQLAGRLEPHAATLVCGPALGGALIGQWVAYELGIGFVVAERRVEPGGPPRYVIPPSLHAMVAAARVLVVDDAINAGSATFGCVDEIRSLGGQVVGIGSIVIRDAARGVLARRLAVPVEYALEVDWTIWPALACPLCAARMPLSAKS